MDNTCDGLLLYSVGGETLPNECCFTLWSLVYMYLLFGFKYRLFNAAGHLIWRYMQFNTHTLGHRVSYKS